MVLTLVAQTDTIGERKVSLESNSLKFSPTPQVDNPTDATALVPASFEFSYSYLDLSNAPADELPSLSD